MRFKKKKATTTTPTATDSVSDINMLWNGVDVPDIDINNNNTISTG